MTQNWFTEMFTNPAQDVVEMTDSHQIVGHYEDESGLFVAGDLDVMSGATAYNGRRFEVQDCGEISFEHTPTGLLVTSEHGAWRFFPAAGELSRIGMASAWIDAA